jgi:hypothetical protein
MIITINNLKQIIKEELENLVDDEAEVDDEGQSIINEMKSIINRLVSYHRRRLEFEWRHFGPFAKGNDDPTFVINDWKRAFNDPNDRYMYWFGLSDQFDFKDKYLNDKVFVQKLIDEIFKMPEWQSFHNDATNITMVLEMLMEGNLNFPKKINSLIILGAEEPNFEVLQQGVDLADSMGLIAKNKNGMIK